MNILFMTLGRMEDVEEHTIYCDLLRCFRDAGHLVYTISPYEKRTGRQTTCEEKNGIHMLHVRTGNVTGVAGLIEKGLAQLSIEPIFIKAIKKYYSDIKFDLVMYSTPPITFCNAIEFVKKRDGAKTYLLLKDIFPQNAVDLGMMTKTGAKGFIYKYFRAKEKKLYALSDHIGCMSKANVQYMIDYDPEIDPKKIEISPNSIEVADRSVNAATRARIREKYGVPQDKTVFVYGGNLGKPQGIPFLIACLKQCRYREDTFFLIVGGGNEYGKLKAFVDAEGLERVKLLSLLPKDDYDTMVGACDIGLIFLDHRFTIPNFPSRLLAYLQAKLPVLAATDSHTDIGKIIVDGGFGWWCESNSVEDFGRAIEESMNADLKAMGEKAFRYLDEVWNVKKQYADMAKSLGWIKD